MEDEIDRYILRIDNADQLGSQARVLGRVLEQRHGGANDYSLIVPQGEPRPVYN
ncbi:MAG: hypothetical protein NVS9B12_08810 [Vulcanimicrobiaceae bacterium]